MRPILLAIAVVALGAVPANPQTFDPTGEVIVTFSTHGFDPLVVEVRRGVRVTFHNLSSSEALTVVSADGSFESWPLGKHGQWSHDFSKAGHHEFFVKENPEVRGAAEVR